MEAALVILGRDHIIIDGNSSLSPDSLPPNRNPNIENDPQGTVIAICWGLCALTTIALWLRIYCRVVYLRCIWWDDYLMVIGWVRGSTVPIASRLICL